MIQHLLCIALSFALFTIVPSTAKGESAKGDTSRARLAPWEESTAPRKDKEHFTVVSAKRWGNLSDQVFQVMVTADEDLRKAFGDAPHFSVAIELMDESVFFEKTGAPSWTNALYFDDRILVPVTEPLNAAATDNIVRSVRHEFTHAFIHAASAGRCPGWLDEGIAQWAEGPVNPLLQNILARHLQSADAVPLTYLQQGFTKLDTKIVGPAYAQSLFAFNSLMRSYGPAKVGDYFAFLRGGVESHDAFKRSFGLSANAFELQMNSALQKWAKNFLERPTAQNVAWQGYNR